LSGTPLLPSSASANSVQDLVGPEHSFARSARCPRGRYFSIKQYSPIF
jgi:hypothetical protein